MLFCCDMGIKKLSIWFHCEKQKQATRTSSSDESDDEDDEAARLVQKQNVSQLSMLLSFVVATQGMEKLIVHFCCQKQANLTSSGSDESDDEDCELVWKIYAHKHTASSNTWQLQVKAHRLYTGKVEIEKGFQEIENVWEDAEEEVINYAQKLAEQCPKDLALWIAGRGNQPPEGLFPKLFCHKQKSAETVDSRESITAAIRRNVVNGCCRLNHGICMLDGNYNKVVIAHYFLENRRYKGSTCTSCDNECKPDTITESTPWYLCHNVALGKVTIAECNAALCCSCWNKKISNQQRPSRSSRK